MYIENLYRLKNQIERVVVPKQTKKSKLTKGEEKLIEKLFAGASWQVFMKILSQVQSTRGRPSRTGLPQPTAAGAPGLRQESVPQRLGPGAVAAVIPGAGCRPDPPHVDYS